MYFTYFPILLSLFLFSLISCLSLVYNLRYLSTRSGVKNRYIQIRLFYISGNVINDSTVCIKFRC